MIVALALMIAVAGYLNFAGTNVAEDEVAALEDNTVIDENGVQRMPGDPFKSIRKENGELIDWKFPLTG